MSDTTEEVVHSCNLCEDRKPIHSMWFCVDCDEVLCITCKTLHLKTKKLSNDQVIPLTEAQNVSKHQIILCSTHPTQLCDLFCLTCELLVCGHCVILTHKKHECCDIGKGTHHIKERLIEMQKKLEVDISRFDSVQKMAEESHAKYLTGMSQIKLKLIGQADRIIQAVTEIKDQKTALLTKLLENEKKFYNVICTMNLEKKVKISSLLLSLQSKSREESLEIMIQALKEAQSQKMKFEDPQVFTIRLPQFLAGIIDKITLAQLHGTLKIPKEVKNDGNVP